MSADTRLSVIAEDGDPQPPPPIPPRSANRPLVRKFHHRSDPPRPSFEKSPPPYNVWTDVRGPNGERLIDLKNNRFVAKRGGWWRLGALALVVIAVVVGLTVGLIVGLRKRNSNE